MTTALAGWVIERAMAAVPLSKIAERRAIAPERLPGDIGVPRLAGDVGVPRLAGDVGVSQLPASLPPQALIRISRPRIRGDPQPHQEYQQNANLMRHFENSSELLHTGYTRGQRRARPAVTESRAGHQSQSPSTLPAPMLGRSDA
jgi:hypothetical protein